jgi:hypothetical protein
MRSRGARFGGQRVFYELRSYDIDPDGLSAYLRWANDQALPLLVGSVGSWLIGFCHAVAKTGELVPTTNVHWVTAWESEQEMDEKWAAARASEGWQRIAKEIVDPATGRSRYHRRVQSTLLKAIPCSPLQ